MSIGNDQASIVFGEKKLVIVVEHQHAMRIAERALGQIRIGACQRRTHLVETNTQVAEQKRVEFGADARPRTAPNGHLPDARDLGNLLSQDGIGCVVQLRPSSGIRC